MIYVQDHHKCNSDGVAGLAASPYMYCTMSHNQEECMTCAPSWDL